MVVTMSFIYIFIRESESEVGSKSKGMSRFKTFLFNLIPFGITYFLVSSIISIIKNLI
ncbi:hypothetical protein SAMN05428962_2751 [Paenibacillus sp. BC26]|nr:hypothetical protein SAMN05428962_2751 [Paenibacillus sp. BC26]